MSHIRVNRVYSRNGGAWYDNCTGESFELLHQTLLDDNDNPVGEADCVRLDEYGDIIGARYDARGNFIGIRQSEQRGGDEFCEVSLDDLRALPNAPFYPDGTRLFIKKDDGTHV